MGAGRGTLQRAPTILVFLVLRRRVRAGLTLGWLLNRAEHRCRLADPTCRVAFDGDIRYKAIDAKRAER